MAGKAGLVMGLAFLFHIIAFGLALGAETRRSIGTPILKDSAAGLVECSYTRDTATGLAAGAILLLLVGQLFIMIITRCLCCGGPYKPGFARTFAVVFFIFSWMSFTIAGICLLLGASANKIQTRGWYNYEGPTVVCKQVRKGIFAAGAAFTFFTMLCSQIYYMLLLKAGGEGMWQSYNGGTQTVGMTSYP